MFCKRPLSSVVILRKWEFIAHHPQHRGKIPVLMKTAFLFDLGSVSVTDPWAAIPAQKGINIQKKLSRPVPRCRKSFIFTVIFTVSSLLLRRG
jgi:hypothetical protein